MEQATDQRKFFLIFVFFCLCLQFVASDQNTDFLNRKRRDTCNLNYFNNATIATLSNSALTIALHPTLGYIYYILDASRNDNVTFGSRGKCMWGISFLTNANGFVGSCGYAASPVFSWSSTQCALTISWTKDQACYPSVTVTLAQGDIINAIKTQLTISLGAPCTNSIAWVYWISDLLINSNNNTHSALLPYLPGVVLTNAFFAQKRSYSSLYPGNGMFSDFMAWNTTSGASVCMFSAPLKPADVAPVSLGMIGETANSYYHHAYGVHVTGGASFTTPPYIVVIGLPFLQCIDHLQVAAGLSRLEPQATVLGDLYTRIAASALVKFDAVQLNLPFTMYPSLLTTLNRPIQVHLAGFEPYGFDRYYPDFLPPASTWGVCEYSLTVSVWTERAGRGWSAPFIDFLGCICKHNLKNKVLNKGCFFARNW
jgi:hypothetical protein